MIWQWAVGLVVAGCISVGGAWLGTRIERARTVDEYKVLIVEAKAATAAAVEAAKAASRLQATADQLGAQQAAVTAGLERAGDETARRIEDAARRLRLAPGGGRIVLDRDAVRLLDDTRTGTGTVSGTEGRP